MGRAGQGWAGLRPLRPGRLRRSVAATAAAAMVSWMISRAVVWVPGWGWGTWLVSRGGGGPDERRVASLFSLPSLLSRALCAPLRGVCVPQRVFALPESPASPGPGLWLLRVSPALSAPFPGLRSQAARAACICHAQIAPVTSKLIQSNL